MPNSLRVTLGLTEAVTGIQIWDGLNGTCQTMPDAEHERVGFAAVALLEQITQLIDWPRLLADAELRHRTLHPGTRPMPPGSFAWPLTRNVCGDCLREALLAHPSSAGCHDWEKEPTVARRGEGTDWARVFAETIKYRRPPQNTTRTRPRPSAAAAKGA